MVINPIIGFSIPIIRIPIKGGIIPIPKKTRLLTMAHMVLQTKRRSFVPLQSFGNSPEIADSEGSWDFQYLEDHPT